ncbi:MAG: hypothetical protein RMK94_16870, partial [Armatimonadota bacterium]|nr:hypothetical protein [Armatimonadota bacterium]
MTQKESQNRLSRLGMVSATIFALLFTGIYLHLWRNRNLVIPPKVEIPKEPPDLTLLVTANRQGKLEVCGCPGKRAEDLAKVSHLVQKTAQDLKSKGTKVTIIEGGDFVGGEDVIPYLLRAYRVTGYQCVALSPHDQKRLPVIKTSANGVQLLLPSDLNSQQVFQASGKVWSIILVNLGQPPIKDEGYWQKMLKELQALKKNKSLLAVLAYVTRKEALELSKRLKGTIDILLIDDSIPLQLTSDSHNLMPDREIFSDKAGEEISGVFLAALPQSRATVLALSVRTKSEQGNSYEIDAEWLRVIGQSEHPQVKRIVDEYYQKRQKQLEQEMQQLMKIASQKAYLPPEFCGKCHQPQYEQWLS